MLSPSWVDGAAGVLDRTMIRRALTTTVPELPISGLGDRQGRQRQKQATQTDRRNAAFGVAIGRKLPIGALPAWPARIGLGVTSVPWFPQGWQPGIGNPGSRAVRGCHTAYWASLALSITRTGCRRTDHCCQHGPTLPLWCRLRHAIEVRSRQVEDVIATCQRWNCCHSAQPAKSGRSFSAGPHEAWNFTLLRQNGVRSPPAAALQSLVATARLAAGCQRLRRRQHLQCGAIAAAAAAPAAKWRHHRSGKAAPPP